MSANQVYYLGLQAEAEAVATVWNKLVGLPRKGTNIYFPRHGTQPGTYSSGALGWTKGYSAQLLDAAGPVYRTWLTEDDALLGYNAAALAALTGPEQATVAAALLRIFPQPVDTTLVRFSQNPLIEMADLPVGYQQNISFMDVIRKPSWLSSGTLSGYNYLCYFSAHTFSYILVAGATQPEGPWTVHATDITVARLEAEGPPFGAGGSPHIGSPHLYVGADATEGLRLYYHGEAGGDFGHASGICYSTSSSTDLGVAWDFEPNIPIGAGAQKPRYMRPSVFSLPGHLNDGDWIAVEEEAKLSRAADGLGLADWTSMLEASRFNRRLVNPSNAQNQPRHSGYRYRSTGGINFMDVWFTRRTDTPERLMVATAITDIPNMEYWELSDLREQITSEFDYEGGLLPVETSAGGRVDGLHHQLREASYLDDRAFSGNEILFYCGGGEFNICGAYIINNF